MVRISIILLFIIIIVRGITTNARVGNVFHCLICYIKVTSNFPEKKTVLTI